LIGGARGLTGQDLRLPSEIDKAAPANPKGIRLKADGDVADLPERIQAAYALLEQAADELAAVLAELKPAYDALSTSGSIFDPTPWTPRLPVIRDRLRTIALHGLAEAEPRSSAGVTSNGARFLYEQGVAVGIAVGKRLDSAAVLLAPLPAEPPRDNPVDEARRLAGRIDRRLDNLVDAARQILGASLPLQPVFDLDPAQRRNWRGTRRSGRDRAARARELAAVARPRAPAYGRSRACCHSGAMGDGRGASACSRPAPEARGRSLDWRRLGGRARGGRRHERDDDRSAGHAHGWLRRVHPR
jgi:hypothetical protein